MEFFNLNNGNKLPKICFGPGIPTRGMKFHSGIRIILDKIEMKKIERNYYKGIVSAIQNGAVFIDYSATYGREDIIAKAIKDLKIERNQIYLTTRVSNKSQFQGNVRETALRSIERFNVDYVDLLMFHWPVPEKYISTWEELIKLQEEGVCKNIGVANCHQHHLEKIIAETSVKPQVNQVEIHPLLSQKNLVGYCQSQNIQMEAYTSLARMDERIVRLPVMKDLARKYQKSISQLILRWHIQNGVIPIFRSFNENRQKENFNVFDFVISSEDMKKIDSININARLRYDPDNCDFSIL